MTLIDGLVLFGSSFAVVFFLGLQSKNVMHSRYIAAMITSLGISTANFLFVKYASTGGLTEFGVAATGGMLGIAAAIYSYDTFSKRKNKVQALTTDSVIEWYRSMPKEDRYSLIERINARMIERPQ